MAFVLSTSTLPLFHLRICAFYLSIVVEDLQWYSETYNKCYDRNPNSNGVVSLKEASDLTQIHMSSFLMTKPAQQTNKKKGTVYTRNEKKFKLCVNACHTKEQEQLISDTLDKLHLEVMALDTKKGESTLNEKEGSVSSGSVGTNVGLSSLHQVEKSNTYNRQKPMLSPSRYSKS